MSKWRAKALEFFPELRSEIQSADAHSHLWVELFARLTTHYSSERLDNETSQEFAHNVYKYALWCDKSADWRTKESAHINFFEGIVPVAIRSGKLAYGRIVQDLVLWIGVPTIKNKAKSFAYSLSEVQRDKFLKDVDDAAKLSGRRSLE